MVVTPWPMRKTRLPGSRHNRSDSGRLLDHINRKHVDLYTTKVLVLDEYDKSLELGFHDEMRKVIRTMPNLSRIILTSATRLVDMPDFLNMSSPEVIDFLEQGQKPRERTAIVEVESPHATKSTLSSTCLSRSTTAKSSSL